MARAAKPSASRGRVGPGDGLTELRAEPLPPPPRPPSAHAIASIPASKHLSLGHMVETNGAGSLETVAGFDSYRARNTGLFPQAPGRCRPDGFSAGLAPGPVPDPAPGLTNDGFVTESVIGRDERVPVGDTTRLPWRAIARLSITYDNGKRATGTGWFLSPTALGTAAHNVFHPVHGEARDILVAPAFDGQTAPFNTFRATHTFCEPGWKAGGREPPPELDYGVVVMPDASVGTRLGWFGFAAFDESQLEPLLVNVSGYPGDRLPPTQYFNGGRIAEVRSQFLLYDFDTEEGMSGAPIFALFDTQRIAVGIHINGSNRLNRARRIDRQLFEVFRRFA